MLKVYTKSGSVYTFTVYGETLRCSRGMREFVVTGLDGLQVGHRLRVWGYPLNFWNEVEKDSIFFSSSPIVKIEG